VCPFFSAVRGPFLTLFFFYYTTTTTTTPKSNNNTEYRVSYIFSLFNFKKKKIIKTWKKKEVPDMPPLPQSLYILFLLTKEKRESSSL
jgi:hypothetical protein